MAFGNPVTRLSELIADVFRTADPPGQRIEILHDAGASFIRFFSGLVDEITPTYITAFFDVARSGIQVSGPDHGHGFPFLYLLSPRAAGNTYLGLIADEVDVRGLVMIGDQIRIGGVGSEIQRLQLWDVSGGWTTDVNGRITIPNDLSASPTFLSWMDQSTNQPYRGYVVQGASDAFVTTVVFRRTDTNAIAPAGVVVSGWLMAAEVIAGTITP